MIIFLQEMHVALNMLKMLVAVIAEMFVWNLLH